MKYHVGVGMVDTAAKIFSSRSLGARAAFPLSADFLASKGYQSKQAPTTGTRMTIEHTLSVNTKLYIVFLVNQTFI